MWQKVFVYGCVYCMCVLCIWVHERECVGRCNCACVCAGDIVWAGVTVCVCVWVCDRGSWCWSWALDGIPNWVCREAQHHHSAPQRSQTQTNTNKDGCTQRHMQTHTKDLLMWHHYLPSCSIFSSSTACELHMLFAIPYHYSSFESWDQWWWSYLGECFITHSHCRFKCKSWTHKTVSFHSV